MLALQTEVVDAEWTAVEPLLPDTVDQHPLGCHRPRVPDRLCLWGLLMRLTTGASWVDVEAILEHRVSDTTLRARRDEWIAAGVFEQLKAEALAAFDRIIGLDLSEVAVDGSLHKAPYGGEGTGPNPIDRAKSGWKWSVASEHHGVPLGWTIDGANRSDVPMLIHDVNIQRRGTTQPGNKQPVRLGLRWIVEATDSWWSNYGQLRRSTDRRSKTPTRHPVTRQRRADHRQTHRLAQPLEPQLNPYPLKSLVL
jgi:transposase